MKSMELSSNCLEVEPIGRKYRNKVRCKIKKVASNLRPLGLKRGQIIGPIDVWLLDSFVLDKKTLYFYWFPINYKITK